MTTDANSPAGIGGYLCRAAGEASEGVACGTAHTFYFTTWGLREVGEFVGRVAVWDG